MNQVGLVGRLATDPELKHTQNGTAVTNFRIAVDREFKREGGPDADFFTIVAWGKLAETVANHLQKGRLISVSGRLETRSYQAQDGSTRWVTEVIASSVRFLDWPEKSQEQQQQASYPPPVYAGAPAPAGGGAPSVPDSDIPF